MSTKLQIVTFGLHNIEGLLHWMNERYVRIDNSLLPPLTNIYTREGIIVYERTSHLINHKKTYDHMQLEGHVFS